MAAQDLSNKEIAQALFVTVKTVEQHLGRVYRKLDIGSRRALAAALAAPGNAGALMLAGELRQTIAPLRLLEREAELAALEAMLACGAWW